MRTIFLLLFLALAFSLSSQKMKEYYYQGFFASEVNGQTEVVLNDKTRVDILTDTFAIEVDFAEKWAESIGQSLYYSEMTGKRPAVLLVVNENTDERYIKRLITVATKFKIRVWILDYNSMTYEIKNK